MAFSNEYRRIAPHIRGRVFLQGPSSVPDRNRWRMEVVNTRTGKIVASDDCTIWSTLADLSDHATGVARAVWFWDLRRKEVQ